MMLGNAIANNDQPSQETPTKKCTVLCTFCVVLGAFISLLLGLFALLLLFLNVPPGQKLANNLATNELGRVVNFHGSVYPVLTWPLSLRINGLDVANPENMQHEQMANIKRLEIAVSPWKLLQGDVVISRLKLRNSSLHLERLPNETANWVFDKGNPVDEVEEGTTVLPDIRRLILENATLTYKDAPQHIDIELTGQTKDDAVIITGDGTYNGQPFTLDAITGGVAAVTNKENFPVKIDLRTGYTTINAKGTLESPGELPGMNLMLTVKGADASKLYPLTGIALLPTPPYDVTGKLSFDGTKWNYNDFTGVMGDSDIYGNLSWDTAPSRPKLTARLQSKKLDFKDLGPLIGLPPEKPMSAEQKKGAAKQAASSRVIPDVNLDVSKLSTLDADVEFIGKRVISPSLPLDDFNMKLELDNRVLRLTPVKFGTANGDVVVYMTVNGKSSPIHADTEINFSKLSLRRLMEGLETSLPAAKNAKGLIGGKLKFSGNGNSLHDMLASADGHAGIGMEGGYLSNLIIEIIGLDAGEALGLFLSGDEVTPIRCIVGDFDVKGGAMNSKALVIDTNDTNILGKATINLGTEKLDVRLEPHPKDASLLSLRTPVTVDGTFKDPSIGIDPTNLVAKGGAAVALSAVLTPIAGILGFIEPGLGEDSNCAQLISSMNSGTGSSNKSNKVPTNANAPEK